MKRTILSLAVATQLLPGCGDDSESSVDPVPSSSSSSGDSENTETSDSDAGTTQGQATVLERVVERMGGAEALQQLSTLQYSVTGRVDAHNETSDPNTGPPRLQHLISAHVAHDLAQARLRYDYVRDIEIVGVVVEQTELFANDRGTYQGANIIGLPGGAMTSDRVGSTWRQQLLLTPQQLIAEVLAGERQAEEAGPTQFDGREMEVLRITDETNPIDVFVDPQTAEVSGLAVVENDMLLRDALTVVRYSDWVELEDGPSAPSQVEISVDGYPVREEVRTDIVANDSLAADLFAFPDGTDSQVDPQLAELGRRSPHGYQMLPASTSDGRPRFVVDEPLMPGVTVLRGIFHNSVVVEQSDGIVLLEAGGYPERSLAVSSWVERNLPDRSIHTVAVTHHHHDVVAGVRTALAGGATLVASEVAEPFWLRVLDAPSTVVPDAWSEAGLSPQTRWVPADGHLVLDDDTHPIEAYHVRARHAEDSVVYSLPQQGLIVVTDLYSPGFPFFTEETIHGAEDFDGLLLELDIPGDTQIVTGVGAGVPTVDEFRAAFDL